MGLGVPGNPFNYSIRHDGRPFRLSRRKCLPSRRRMHYEDFPALSQGLPLGWMPEERGPRGGHPAPQVPRCPPHREDALAQEVIRWSKALKPLVRVVAKQVGHKPGSKVIVFAELRDTVEFLADLFRAEGIEMDRFTGRGRRRGGRG